MTLNKVVHIRRNCLYEKTVDYYEKEPKTKTSKRDIPLNNALIEDLKKYMDWFRITDKDFSVNIWDLVIQLLH